MAMRNGRAGFQPVGAGILPAQHFCEIDPNIARQDAAQDGQGYPRSRLEFVPCPPVTNPPPRFALQFPTRSHVWRAPSL
jgi:hypothetical protein